MTDFLDEINIADTSRKFIQRKGRRQGPGARWTWRQQRGGRWYHSQPDYIMAREVDTKAFWSVGFRQPRFHDLDHRTGWGHTTLWEAEGGVQRECSEEAAVEPLDLGRDVAANRSSSDAPLVWPPVPNGGGIGYTVKLELLFAKIRGIKPHASVRASLPSLRAATSRRLSVTSRGGIGQPQRRNPNRATTRWNVRLRSESTCMRGGSPQGTPSHCISLQSKSTMTYQRIARSGLSQGA